MANNFEENKAQQIQQQHKRQQNVCMDDSIDGSEHNETKENYQTNSDVLKVISCEVFTVHKVKQPGLRANVFVSKECTRDLSQYIVLENWGQDNGNLYKYLDYIFRCQIFDKQVKKITYNNGEEIVIFHTGLQRRNDINFLYFVLKKNDPEKKKAEQKWRVPAGKLCDHCLSYFELINQWKLNNTYFPKRSKFYSSLSELLFDESYGIEVNWPERLRTNKERIYQQLKGGIPAEHNKHNKLMTVDKTKLVADLVPSFEEALKKSENKAKANPRLAVAQGFVETKHYKKRVELLLPLKIEYPKKSGNYHTFALALRKSDKDNKYSGMSLLTMSMAYANARLVGYVDSSWLTNNDDQLTQNIKKGENKKIIPRSLPPTINNGLRSMGSLRGNNGRNSGLVLERGGHGGNGNVFRGSQNNIYQQHPNLPPIPQNGSMPTVDEVRLDYTNINYRQQQQYWNYQQQQQMMYQQHQHQQRVMMDNVDDADNEKPLSYRQEDIISPPKGYSQSAVMPPVLNPENVITDDEEDLITQPFVDNNIFGALDDEISSLKIPRSAPPKSSNHKIKFRNAETKQKEQKEQKEQPATTQPRQQQQQIQRPHHPQHSQYRQHPRYHNNNQPISHHQVQLNALPQRIEKMVYNDQPHNTTLPYFATKSSQQPINNVNNVNKTIDNKPKYLLLISGLPGDCGVNTLHQIFKAQCHLESVHYIFDDKTAILRCSDQSALDSAMQFAKMYPSWRCSIIKDSPYLENYDQQNVWQYQESDQWKPHNPSMAQFIDQIPQRKEAVIDHGQRRKYLIEKYNDKQGRQTNMRTGNQRMIRRVTVHVWAPRNNPIRDRAIPKLYPITIRQQQQQQPGKSKLKTILNPDSNVFEPMPLQNNINKKKTFHSVPPQKVIQKVNIAQIKNTIHNSDNSDKIVVDETDYPNWEHLPADDDDYDELKTELKTDKFSGIWFYSGPAETIEDSGLHTQYLWISADYADAEVIFDDGYFNFKNSDDAFATFHQDISAAIALFDEDEDTKNILLFQCEVKLTDEHEAELAKNKTVTLTDEKCIKLTFCVKIKKDILEQALE